jgi:hypothetical protein
MLNPTTTPSGVLSKDLREKEIKKERKMPSTMATTFMPASKGSARTPLGPIMFSS